MNLDYFPPALLKPEAKNDVINWLHVLPLPIDTKKSLLAFWLQTYGQTATQSQWQQATGEPYV